MIDDAFLRQVAALQANLKMLESQSDALSDLADMKELRLYKARLADYIDAHASAGHLPRDPFRAIERRLIALSEFFAAADQEYQRLKGWKANWLNSVPAVCLADLQSARTDLTDLVAEVPAIQERLGQRLSPADWDASLALADIHPELMACAQCVGGLKLPEKAEKRHDLYQFSRGEGSLTKKASTHFTTMGLRIEALAVLHADHGKALAATEHHLSNDDFRSAEEVFQGLGKGRFSDLDYSLAESRITKLLRRFSQFKSLDSSLDQLLENGDYKAVKAKFDHLRGLIGKPDSELGRESLALLQRMNSRFVTAQEAGKKRRVRNFTMISLLVLGIVATTYFVISENAKAERVRVEAQAKAERVRVEAQAKAAREAAEAKTKLPSEIGAGRVGASLGVPLLGKAVMRFAFCPAGSFMMGSPSSEDGRGSDENQVRVTLSKDFWMAKTEVTQAQWRAVMGSDPSHFNGDDQPVENVSWNDAQEFIERVNGSDIMPDGWKMTLPTEAQWEYACRAGETGPYSGGSIDPVAWYEGNSEDKTHAVGLKEPNAWGLYDVHGNVWEWCSDWYGNELGGGVDPQRASSGTCRVSRGGGWDNVANLCRVASRNLNDPSNTIIGIGFRVALSSVR